MKRTIFVLAIVALFATVQVACAFGFSDVKGWFSGTAVAVILSVILGIGIIGKYTPWTSKFLVAVGAAFTSVGLALADGKVSGAELQDCKDKLIVIRNLLKGKKDGG